jgi:hypothetical protein
MIGSGTGQPRRRGTLLVLAVLAAVLLPSLLLPGLLPSAAHAQAQIDDIVQALRNDPVYVDPSAESALPPAAVDRLRAAVAAANTPIVVAILPASAGTPRELIPAIGSQLDQPVTVAVVAGRSFGAASTAFSVGALADAALEQHRGEGAEAILLDFVQRVDQAARGQRPPQAQPEPEPSGVGGLLLLGAVVAGAGALGFAALRSKRRRDQERQREFDDVRTAAEEDLVALGEDIRELDLDVSMPGAPRRAVEDYTAALDRYQQASDALNRAREARDLAPVASALEEGRYLMASAKARLRGEAPPERRAPCFFDPRHGPSVEDVEWAPQGGAPRMVPACAADAQRVREGLEPRSRQVMVDGTPMPYWSAPGWFAPWAGGYFGLGGSGFFTGLLLGQALGGWGAWDGWGDSAGGFGDGDVGGGDFGDFGGGDFGDFGGGDFGGGDF